MAANKKYAKKEAAGGGSLRRYILDQARYEHHDKSGLKKVLESPWDPVRHLYMLACAHRASKKSLRPVQFSSRLTPGLGLGG